ncbi:MAG: ComF family protein [Gallionellaceae bacterium]|nr:ComF family protein [Gallionellaceae bacterium]
MSGTILTRGLSRLARLLPAQPCLLCGEFSRDGVWCDACSASLPRLNAPCCPQCALPTPLDEYCGNCLKRPPHFDHTLAAFAYAFPIDKLVQALKYNEHLLLANALADELAQRIEILPDCIVPMPLHSARLRERGFNPSAELAKRLAAKTGTPLLLHASHRVRATLPQAALTWKARRGNVRQAFDCTAEVAGKHVAIVDDVMTSGASLNELARALRRAGAREVSAWVVARTLAKNR